MEKIIENIKKYLKTEHKKDDAEFSGTYLSIEVLVICLLGCIICAGMALLSTVVLPILMVDDLLGFIKRGCKLK